MYVIIDIGTYYLLASKIDPVVVVLSTGSVMYYDYRNYNSISGRPDLPLSVKYFLPYIHLYDNDALIHIKRALIQLARSFP